MAAQFQSAIHPTFDLLLSLLREHMVGWLKTDLEADHDTANLHLDR